MNNRLTEFMKACTEAARAAGVSMRELEALGRAVDFQINQVPRFERAVDRAWFNCRERDRAWLRWGNQRWRIRAK